MESPTIHVEYAWTTDSKYVSVANLDNVLIWDCHGNLVTEIPNEGRYPQGLMFLPGDHQLLVVYRNGDLVCFDIAGTELWHTQLNDIQTDSFDEVTWHFLEDDIGVQIGTDFALIEKSSQTGYTYVSSFLHFDPAEETFYVYAQDGTMTDYMIARYPWYDLDSLIKRGQEILGGNQMPHEQREKYGLG